MWPLHSRKDKAGMSILEYSVLLAVVVIALLAVQVSLRRAISSRWKQAIDGGFGSGRQYEPGVTTIH